MAGQSAILKTEGQVWGCFLMHGPYGGVSQLNKLKKTAMCIYPSYVLLVKKCKFELTEAAKHPAH